MDRFTIRHTLEDLPFLPHGRAVALGLFDGVHEGHISVIRDMVRYAASHNLVSCVQTFINIPKSDGSQLTTVEEKLEILTSLGVDEMLVLDYNSVKDVEAEDFITDHIMVRMGAETVFCGEDFRFGRGAAGDAALLSSSGAKYGFGVDICKELMRDGRIVSSTWLRELLKQGDVNKYSDLTGGRYFSYSGTVVHGKELGRQLGFPTANLLIPEEKTVVRRGVYASRITLGRQILYGVTNVGLRPTVEDADADICETCIFDFDEDIYGARIKVELISFIRPETRFGSADELMECVTADKIKAREVLQVYCNL